MKFTDRFLEVPIRVYSIKVKELTDKEVCTPCWLKFNPFELSNYKPSWDEDEPDIEIVHITLKNGYSTLVYLSPHEFEKLINNFQK